jgi:predicted nucleic acid-binding protein
MPDNKFIDTSVLVYAFDKSEQAKHETASKLVRDMFERGEKGAISAQVLLELYNVLTRFISDPLSPADASSIVYKFFEAAGWIKLDYNTLIARRAVTIAAERKTKIWDTLIAETMKENGIDTIITENEKDFKKIPGIKVINPFK